MRGLDVVLVIPALRLWSVGGKDFGVSVSVLLHGFVGLVRQSCFCETKVLDVGDLVSFACIVLASVVCLPRRSMYPACVQQVSVLWPPMLQVAHGAEMSLRPFLIRRVIILTKPSSSVSGACAKSEGTIFFVGLIVCVWCEYEAWSACVSSMCIVLSKQYACMFVWLLGGMLCCWGLFEWRWQFSLGCVVPNSAFLVWVMVWCMRSVVYKAT